MSEQDQLLTEAIAREGSRLRSFIRRRVQDVGDAEDILQDVFYELVATYRLMQPVEKLSAWLFQVARNRITDRFRRRRPVLLADLSAADAEQGGSLEDLLPSAAAGPDALYVRGVLLEALEEALDELPQEQRAVFVAQELEGRSFKELAAESGVSINTLLARKRYAVRHLRRRLQGIYDEFVREE
ncbi:MAG: sigma-70 family RNA polymerase sigma factor [Acidobacteriota bacterium]|nr:sigma-70 family RNA polymerase sigma factor [Acidobacteriota bacterium]